MKKFVYLPVLFFLILSIQVQETIACAVYSDPKPGTIIDTVRCRVNPQFSYALFLPKNYSKTSKWPVICIFDPAARGKLAITNFRQGVTTELRVFNGDHTLPSPDLLQEALEWFELQAMKKGIKPKDLAFIDSLFVKYKNRTDIFLKQGNLIESARTYAFAIKDFPDQMAIPKLKEKLDSLQSTKDYQKSVLEWDKIRTQELEIQNTLMTAFQGHVLMKSLPDSLRNWWGLQIKMLRKMENNRDTL